MRVEKVFTRDEKAYLAGLSDGKNFAARMNTPRDHMCGPKRPDHPSIHETCPACKMPFVAGDYTTLIPLGPGDRPEAQREAREGRAYNAITVEVHWSCATGETTP